jgi:phosphatidylserine decarboxylase
MMLNHTVCSTSSATLLKIILLLALLHPYTNTSLTMSHQENTKNVPEEHQVHRIGSWLPSDHRVHKKWLSGIIERVEGNPKELHPVLREFKDLIENNTRIYILVNSMFEEIPTNKQVRDYHHMLELFNHILTTAPEWSDHEYSIGMVGTPFNAILDWPMVSIYT